MSKLIFFVDDEAFVRRVLDRVLKRLRPDDQIVEFKQPMTLLAAMQSGPQPDLILTDRTMSKDVEVPMLGEELARRLRMERGYQGPILMLTGDLVKGLPHITEILSKPIKELELAAALARHLDGA